MRRPPYHRDPGGRLEVKMTPMIDVIFLLLIFFVCTASFHNEEVLPLPYPPLPGTIETAVQIDPLEEDLDEIIVKILWRGGGVLWEINGREYYDLEGDEGVEGVLATVRRLKSDLPVILDVEPAVPMEDVIDLYDLCRRVGLQRVQFAAPVEDVQRAGLPAVS